MRDYGSGGDASRSSLLKRIAEILETPLGAPYELEGTAADRFAATARDDVRAMMSAFVRIGDPERRRACLDYVTALADGTDGAGPDQA